MNASVFDWTVSGFFYGNSFYLRAFVMQNFEEPEELVDVDYLISDEYDYEGGQTSSADDSKTSYAAYSSQDKDNLA